MQGRRRAGGGGGRRAPQHELASGGPATGDEVDGATCDEDGASVYEDAATGDDVMWMRKGRATDEDAVEGPARLGIGGFFLFFSTN
jgi:hypothetical protein